MFAFLDRWFGRKPVPGEPTPLDAYLTLIGSEKSRVRDIAALPMTKDELKKALAARIAQSGESEREQLKKAYLLLADFQEAGKEADARDAMINEVRSLMMELKVIEAGSGAVGQVDWGTRRHA